MFGLNNFRRVFFGKMVVDYHERIKIPSGFIL